MLKRPAPMSRRKLVITTRKTVKAERYVLVKSDQQRDKKGVLPVLLAN